MEGERSSKKAYILKIIDHLHCMVKVNDTEHHSHVDYLWKHGGRRGTKRGGIVYMVLIVYIIGSKGNICIGYYMVPFEKVIIMLLCISKVNK